MHYISLQERSSQRDKADELSLLTWLGGDESGIDRKAAVDFKHTSWSRELRALLWQKVGPALHGDAKSAAGASSSGAEHRSGVESNEIYPSPAVGGSWRPSKPAPLWA